MNATDKRLLTPDQAGQYLNIASKTLAQWRWRGIGPPHIKLGGKSVRYRASDLEAYLIENTVFFGDNNYDDAA